ncbi:VanW family protein [Clostridium sp.]|uniref:VanW family protein n=1 Tax=Clostridium sp. TaxID=1506 RepID=UPI00260AD4B7|nr:VanW family protein [Clostridium sp.]
MRSKRIDKFSPKKIGLGIAIAVLIIILAILSVIGYTTYSYKDKTYDGIFVSDVNVSNLSENELKEKVSNHYSNLLDNFKVTFTYKDMFNETYSAKDLGFYYDFEKISNEVFYFGKGGNIISNSVERLKLKSTPYYFNFNPQSNPEALKEKLAQISGKIDKKKVEPKLSFSGNSVSATKEAIGYKVDLEKLTKIIVKDIDDHGHDTNSCKIEIPVEELKPELTQAEVQKMTILGTYETKLPSLEGGRTHNIRTYLSKLNGTVLMPGEIFSADKEGEERNASNGYTYAPGFINNKVVDIMAGGICQGVTTLYNAVLYADLKIVERAPHSLPVTYAPIGRDATMASGVVDLKFKNNLKNPVIVQTYITNNGHVKANIWGINEQPNKKIVIAVDQHGPKSATTYREIYENGVLVKKELLSKDNYH